MIRPRTTERRINAPTAMQLYRLSTEAMTVFVLPKTKNCPCCKRQRSTTQFIETSRICESCRRPR